MANLKTLLLLVALLITSSFLFAQGGDWVQHYPNYENYPYQNVELVKLDSLNNIWLATSHGLAKYDRQTWTKYLVDDIPELDQDIYDMEFDKDNVLWIGTREGLVKFDGNSWTKYDTSNTNIPGNRIYDVTFDKNNSKWVNVYSPERLPNEYYSLAKLNGNDFDVFDLDTLMGDEKEISYLTNDQEGNIWIGGYNRMLMFNGNQWKHYLMPDDFNPGLSAEYLKVEDTSSVWVGLDSGWDKLLRYQNGEWIFYADYPGYEINELIQDSSGNIWVATRGDGFHKYDGQEWRTFTRYNSDIITEAVQSMILDDNGILWLGSSLGLNTFDGGNTWTFLQHSTNIPDYLVNYVYIDGENNKWIGTEHYGLVQFDNSKWTIYDKTNTPIIDNAINCITEDKNGNLIVGTRRSGFAIYNGDSWQVFTVDNSPVVQENINHIAVDSNNKLWLANGKYLLSYFEGNWETFYSVNSGLPDATISSIAINSNNDLWLSTIDSGLVKFDYENNGWMTYKTTNSGLPNNIVNFVAIDNDTVWCATEYGIAKLYNDEWKSFTSLNSDIPGSDAECIIASNGIIWVSFYWSNGIAKFDGNVWKYYNHSFFDWVPSGISPWHITKDEYNNIWASDWIFGLVVFNEELIVDIENEDQKSLPSEFVTLTNYPNPFNPSTTINFNLPTSSEISIRIYDITGALVNDLVPGKYYPSGHHQINWNGVDTNNQKVASGVYLCYLHGISSKEGPTFNKIIKLALIK